MKADEDQVRLLKADAAERRLAAAMKAQAQKDMARHRKEKRIQAQLIDKTDAGNSRTLRSLASAINHRRKMK